jgi:1-acyl-sn-glycerol-3-phosphate acyltransferase
MAGLRIWVRTALFIIVTLGLAPPYLFLLLFFYPIRHRIGPGLIRFYSKICLAIFGVRFDKARNCKAFRKKRKGVLIISNHASFLDIFVLSSLFGTVFVSKAEVRHYPIIGLIAALSGVVFFDRGSLKDRRRVLRKITNEYHGRTLTVFPQGTTGRITDRLPFQRGIFKVVELNPNISLLPVTLHYKKDAEIAWHKPQTFRENAMRIAARKSIHMSVTVHEPLTIEDCREMKTDQICRVVEEIVLGTLEDKKN